MSGTNELGFSQQTDLQRIVREAHAARARLMHAMVRALLVWLRKATADARDATRRLAIRVAAALVRVWRAHVEQWQRGRKVAELQAWSDRDLKDIGVNRSEIHWAVRYGRHDPLVTALAESRPAALRRTRGLRTDLSSQPAHPVNTRRAA